MTLTSILAFIFVFGVLVAVHEWGHFIAAKKSGVLVREFAIGMGPKIFQTVRQHTAYTLRILPVGGYVRMAGLDEGADLSAGQRILLTTNAAGVVTKIDQRVDDMGQRGLLAVVDTFDLTDELYIQAVVNDEARRFVVDHDAVLVEQDGTTVQIAPRDTWFQSAKLWQRAVINIAGPVMNFNLALLVFVGLGFAQPSVGLNENIVGEVTTGYPAKTAGLQSGDKLVAIDGVKTPNWNAVSNQISAHKTKMTVTYERNGQQNKTTITPKKVTESGTTRYVIGITQLTHTDLASRVKYGASATWSMMTRVVDAILHLFSGGFSLDKLGGPVAIAKETSSAAQAGWLTLFGFMAVLSINLGLMNLLPIPALDGGKLLLNLVEAIYRKPLPARFETGVTVVGAGLLVLLMIAVTINDLLR